MIATTMRRAGCSFAVCCTVAGIAAPAFAGDESPWDGDSRAQARLIAGAPRAGAGSALRAGIEIRLGPGWKTYWRYPGDAGVPPRFDFAHSTNVKDVRVLWPVPHRFADEGGQTIGYKDGVVLPLRVTPQDATQPVTLRLSLDYAVCEKLCVPAQASAELALGADAPSTHEAELAAFEARVPAPGALDDGRPLAIHAVRRDPSSPQRVIVDVGAPGNVPVDLFAEGPTPAWALPLPTPAPGAPPGQQRFVFDLDGLPPGATAAGAVLTLTAVAGESAVETRARLD